MVRYLRSGDDASAPPQPTEAELAILNVLWDLGPSTVRQVHERLAADHATGYTTVLKMLQIMHQKGLVQRDEEQRAHVYRPSHSRSQTQRQLTSDLARRAFDGSISQLVLHALGDGAPARREDLEEIRALLDRLEEGS